MEQSKRKEKIGVTMEKIGVFLDYHLVPKTLPKNINKWQVVRSDKEFRDFIVAYYQENKRMPDLFSFSHDATPEHIEFYFINPKGTKIPYENFETKTFLHSAKWLLETCKLNGIPMDFKVCSHSENVLGRENIIKLVNSYKEEKDCFYMDWKEYDYDQERKAIYDSIKAREFNEFEEELRIDNIRKKLEKELYDNKI